jgi:hypothetical protein
MQRIKLLVYLAVWKRPEITEICFAGIKRMQTHPNYEIDALAVISEESMIPLCEDYGIGWTMTENSPLGAKKNYGLSQAKKMNFDYLMEIGSDDLVTNDLLTHYLPFLNHGFIGVKDICYMDSASGDCRRLMSKSTYGAGRVISRGNLEKMDWKLWLNRINSGLDNNSVMNMAVKKIGYKQVPEMESPGVIDIKSEVNIWPFNVTLGEAYDKEKIFGRLSETETELIERCYSQELR